MSKHAETRTMDLPTSGLSGSFHSRTNGAGFGSVPLWLEPVYPPEPIKSNRADPDSAAATTIPRSTASRTQERAALAAPENSKTRAADRWNVINGRRLELIEQKYKGGLDSDEADELEKLKREVYAYRQELAPRSTELLDAFDARVEKLRIKLIAEAAKRKKV
jgi:hypothetical protein